MAWLWLLGVGVQLALLVLTAFPPFTPGLGVPTWHHNASLVAALLLTAAVWTPLTRDRAFAGKGVLVTTLLALVSAFLLLYLKADLKEWGLKDWAKWWHVAWSWFSITFLLGHSWVNRRGIARTTKRLLHGFRAASANLAFYLVALAAIPLTWSAWGANAIQDPNYILVTHWTWLAFAAPAYATWAVTVARAKWWGRPTLLSPGAAKDFVSAHLLPITIIANLTGFPLLYFGTKDLAIKYVAKWWHTWPSIVMAILIFAHVLHFWPGVKGHWKDRMSQQSAGRPEDSGR